MARYALIQLKRVYETVEKADGRRFLADRIWPRGVKKTELDYDEWLKDLCPSNSLRKAWHNNEINYPQFEKNYRKELRQHTENLIKLAEEAACHPVTLLSSVKDIEHSHLPILRKAIIEQIEENEFNVSRPASSPVCYSSED